ncbi:MAG TPA: SDR family oxidoreductase [Steroidobacteraceae bacterium]|nr:SDR family oxidoreductase [Steroidobacteraceae bacterium]
MRKPRVVVVTGASAGVGRATALEFARQGANVALVARNREALEAARTEVESHGVRALVLPLDVADAQAVERAAETVEEQLGPIDVWVNDAMVTVFSPVALLQADEVRRVTEVTYLGTVNGTLAALRRMLERDRGVIIQVGSALSYRAIPLQAAYCGAKFAIRGFTSSLRTELLHTHSAVHVTMVQMPALNTPQFDWCRTRLPDSPQPVPPIYQPEVAARAIYWSSRHRRRELYVGGSTVAAIWGNRLLSGWLDRYLARTGYAAQSSHELNDPARPDNLWQSPPGDRGAHGRFDARARDSSRQLWLSTHRSWLLTAGLAGVALGGWLSRRTAGSQRSHGSAHH